MTRRFETPRTRTGKVDEMERVVHRKKLISRVLPGVPLTRASAFRLTSLLSSEDLPTFERR